MSRFNGDALYVVAKKFPKAFSSESIQRMIEEEMISFESASNLLAITDGSISKEDMVQFGGITDTPQSSEDHIRVAKTKYFEDLKFKALLECIKEDDTLLYEEFVEIDNARKSLMNKIITREENKFNTLLSQVKSANGCDTNLIDGLIKTKVRLEDLS